MLGFPRSGTTLTDVLLDGHPAIRMVEEQNTILDVVQTLAGMGSLIVFIHVFPLAPSVLLGAWADPALRIALIQRSATDDLPSTIPTARASDSGSAPPGTRRPRAGRRRSGGLHRGPQLHGDSLHLAVGPGLTTARPGCA